jgi:DNA (cytosine-5)-methyltransferase 1
MNERAISNDIGRGTFLAVSAAVERAQNPPERRLTERRTVKTLGHTFISLFSGAGGLDLGLEQAGCRCVYASDIDEDAVRTLEANRGFRTGSDEPAFADAYIGQADIRQLTADDILSKAGLVRGDVPLLTGGPPCQSWSSAGHQHGFKDPRGQVFDDFVRLAGELGVRWLLLENVRGLLTARGPDGQPGSALTYVRKQLLREGFQTVVSLLNAADYGVPQRRVRLFIVGFRTGDPPLPPGATHAKAPDLIEPKKPWVTLGEALSALPAPAKHEIQQPSGRLAADLARVEPGRGLKSPGKRERTRPGGHWGYKQGAFVADLAQSARTVTANAQQDWVRDPEHGLRRLCPRECAALQGFPEGWVFEGGRATQYRLIGNAVPPPLARALGASLLRHSREESGTLRSFDDLLPLSARLLSAINYTLREENSNGASRRANAKRISRLLDGGDARR